MYVGTVMHTTLITITPETSVKKANEIIKKRQIDHLLVVDKNEKLLGIVSDRDLKQSWASPATTLSVHELNYLLDHLTVEMIMIKKIISVTPDTTIERAAQTMRVNRINALPVMENGKLVGIITSRDVMDILLDAIGIGQDSFRFTVLAYDRTGLIAEVTRVLKRADINIRSIMVWPEKKHKGLFHLVMRVNNEVGLKAVELLTQEGFKVLTEHISDLTPYLPK